MSAFLDEDLVRESVPKAERFYKLCILPELLGKWFTRSPTQCNTEQTLQLDAVEDDDGSWCICKQDKGGRMIGCDNNGMRNTIEPLQNNNPVS